MSLYHLKSSHILWETELMASRIFINFFPSFQKDERERWYRLGIHIDIDDIAIDTDDNRDRDRDDRDIWGTTPSPGQFD